MNAKEFKKNFKVICKKCKTDKYLVIKDETSVSYREESHNFDYIECLCLKCGTRAVLY